MTIRSKILLAILATLSPLLLFSMAVAQNNLSLSQQLADLDKITSHMERLNHLQVSVASLPAAPNDFLSTGATTEYDRYAQAVSQVRGDLLALAEGAKADEISTLLIDTGGKVDALIVLGEEIFSIPDPVGNPDGIALMRQMDELANALALGALAQAHSLTMVEMEAANATFSQEMARANQRLLYGIPLIMLFSLAVGMLFARSLTAPLRDLKTGAERIADGRFDTRLAIHTGDEVEAVSTSFNQMAGRLSELYDGLEKEVAERTAELTLSEARYRGLVTTATDAIITIGSDRRIRFFNQAAERTFGYPAAEVLGRDVGLLIPVEYAQAHKIGIQRYLETGEAHIIGQTVELKGVRKSGKVFPLDLSLSEVLTDQEHVFTAIIRDITERKLAERELRLVRFSMNRARDSFFLIGADGMILDANQEACRRLGYSHQELLRKKVYEFDPNYDQKSWREKWQLAQDKKSLMVESHHQAKDGRVFPVEIAVNALEFEGGSYLVAIARDITERRQAEEKIRKLSRALEHSLNAAIIYDRQGVIEYVNDSFSRMTGYASTKMIGQQLAVLRTTIARPDSVDKVWQIIQNGIEWQGEFNNQRQDGTRYWVSASISPIRDEQGRITHFIETHEDITERKQAEVEIRQQNRDLNLLNHVISAASASMDPVKILDTICQELRTAFEVTHTAAGVPDAKGTVLHIVAESREEGQPSVMGVEIPILDSSPMMRIWENRKSVVMADLHQFLQETWGRKWWAAENGSLMVAPLIAGDEVLGTLGLVHKEKRPFTTHEVTLVEHVAAAAAQVLANARLLAGERRRRTELEALHRAGLALSSSLDITAVLKEMLSLALNLVGAMDAYVYFNRGGQLTFAAKQWVENAPEPPTPLTLKRGGITETIAATGERIVIPDVLNDPVYAHRLQAGAFIGLPLKSGEAVLGVINIAFKTAHAFTEEELQMLELLAAQAGLAVQNARLYEAEQSYAAELENRVAERTAELSAANTKLAHAVRAKDEFLANMSHELRTPLSSILLRTDLLRRQVYGRLTGEQVDSLSTIDEAGQHLLSLINDILDVAKIEAGKMELAIESVLVTEVCQGSLHLVEEMAEEKGIDLAARIDPTAVSLHADERRLKQILVNLLSNAVKFTPAGGKVGLEVSADAGQERIRFTVWDTGIGIRAEDLDRLFLPFEQADSSLSRQFEGTGLGLALVRRLAEMHQGYVFVTSEVGKGSRFTVTLPWHPDHHLAEEENRNAADSPPETTAEKAGQTILLADDNETLVMGMVDYLSQIGYRVEVARNGAEAVAAAGQKAPDLILMDTQMPVLDGLEAIRQIRAMAELTAVPIISLTALAMPGDRERCLAAGANAYLSKPVVLSELKNLIERLISETA